VHPKLIRGTAIVCVGDLTSHVLAFAAADVSTVVGCPVAVEAVGNTHWEMHDSDGITAEVL